MFGSVDQLSRSRKEPGFASPHLTDAALASQRMLLQVMRSLAGARIPYRIAFVIAEHEGVRAFYEFAHEDYV